MKSSGSIVPNPEKIEIDFTDDLITGNAKRAVETAGTRHQILGKFRSLGFFLAEMLEGLGYVVIQAREVGPSFAKGKDQGSVASEPI